MTAETHDAPPADQRTLRQLHDDLRSACAELVDPTVYDDERDDGSTVVVEGDSLLTQLEDAAGSSSMSGGGPAKSQPIPINPDAVALYGEISKTTAQWCTEPTVEQRIRTATNQAGQSTDETHLRSVLSKLQYWVGAITTLFNPPRKLHLAAPCPACGKRMAWVTDDDGDKVQRPALDLQQVGEPGDRSWECACLACRHRWPHGNLEHLALVLDQERQESKARVTVETLSLWRDGSVHRNNLAGSNMAGPVEPFRDTSEGGSAA